MIPILIGLLIAAVAVALKLFCEKRRTREPGAEDGFMKFHTRLTLLDALIGVGLAVVLIELPFSRALIRSEVESVLHYPDIFEAPSHLRERFSPSKLSSYDGGIHRARSRIAGIDAPGELADSLVEMVTHSPIRTDLNITREHKLQELPRCDKHLLVKETITYTLFGPKGDTLRIPLYAMMDPIRGVPPESLCRFVSVTTEGRAEQLPSPRVEEAGGRFRFSLDLPIQSTGGQIKFGVTTRKRIPLTDRWNSYAIMPTHGFTLTFRYKEIADKRKEPQLDIYGLAQERGGPVRLQPENEGDGFKVWRYSGWLFTNQSWAVAWADEGK